MLIHYEGWNREITTEFNLAFVDSICDLKRQDVEDTTEDGIERQSLDWRQKAGSCIHLQRKSSKQGSSTAHELPYIGKICQTPAVVNRSAPQADSRVWSF